MDPELVYYPVLPVPLELQELLLQVQVLLLPVSALLLYKRLMPPQQPERVVPVYTLP